MQRQVNESVKYYLKQIIREYLGSQVSEHPLSLGDLVDSSTTTSSLIAEFQEYVNIINEKENEVSLLTETVDNLNLQMTNASNSTNNDLLYSVREMLLASLALVESEISLPLVEDERPDEVSDTEQVQPISRIAQQYVEVSDVDHYDDIFENDDDDDDLDMFENDDDDDDLDMYVANDVVSGERSSELDMSENTDITKNPLIQEQWDSLNDEGKVSFIFVRYSHLPYHYTANGVRYKLTLLGGSQIGSTIA